VTDLASSPRVSLYARVSTTEQSTELQVRDLLAYAERQGWAVPTQLRFIDEGISGVRDNRPALDRLRVLVRAGKVEIVLATKLDRLGRSVLGVLTFYEECDAAKVRVIVTEQGFDTSTSVGRLTRGILLELASFERDLIVERTQAGIARARAKGVRFGRPPKDTAPGTAAKIAELRAAGRSWREIAQHVRVTQSRARRLFRGVSEGGGSKRQGSDLPPRSSPKATPHESGGDFDTATGSLPAGG
jgi:DNA invertase Pin-like site-specific DNA recombinase